MFLRALIIIGQYYAFISSELIRVTLEFSEYKNEKMLNKDGGCCEKAGIIGLLCSDTCKTWFELCFTTYPYNNFKKCVYSANTSVIATSKQNNFRNGEKLSNTLTNPISFEINTTRTPGMGIHIKAWHNKTASKQRLLIDEFKEDQRFYTKYYVGNDLNIIGSKTSLKFKMRINCTNDFLSSSCDPLCNDPVQIKSHFICEKYEKKGKRVCLIGWSGPGCNIAVCSTLCNINHGYCNQPGQCICQAGWKDGVGTHKTCNTCITTIGCANGKCVNGNDCVCEKGWKGKLCDQAKCNVSCNHGNCTKPDYCVCDHGWKDSTTINKCDRCEIKKGCVHGQCVIGNDCVCPKGWKGASCDQAICNPSCSHGNCTAPGNCLCKQGWKGTSCNTCIKPKNCVNGQCVKGNDCVCLKGWKGASCDQAICNSSCSHGNCTKPDNCVCEQGWEGASCNTCIKSKSCVHGQCVKENDCVCLKGWKGASCDQAICNPSCSHGNCTKLGSCVCKHGWEGKSCNTCIKPKTCVHGICVMGNDCHCNKGWKGQLCDKAICNPSCDMKHGSCNQPGDCICASGWQDAVGTNNTCDTCIKKDSCVHGQCVKGNDCVCQKGWKGASCDQAICSLSCDMKHGSCNQPGDCICEVGWTDKNGTNNTCNSCVSKTRCVHGGCLKGNDCVCLKGWKGDLCDQALCSVGCDTTHGYCTSPGTCVCKNGWTNINCTTCVSEPGCKHGECVLGNDCQCNEGWSGQLCDKAICDLSCNTTNANCTVPGVCSCHEGWRSRSDSPNTCNQCVKKQGCSENGYCYHGNDCICKDGWEGENCLLAIIDCSLSTCDKSTTEKCRRLNDSSYDCQCFGRWSGARCAEMSMALEDPCGCQNGACVVTTEARKCVCHEDYTGDLCLEPAVKSDHQQDTIAGLSKSLFIGLMIAIACLIMLLLGAGLKISSAKKKKLKSTAIESVEFSTYADITNTSQEKCTKEENVNNIATNNVHANAYQKLSFHNKTFQKQEVDKENETIQYDTIAFKHHLNTTNNAHNTKDYDHVITKHHLNTTNYDLTANNNDQLSNNFDNPCYAKINYIQNKENLNGNNYANNYNKLDFNNPAFKKPASGKTETEDYNHLYIDKENPRYVKMSFEGRRL